MIAVTSSRPTPGLAVALAVMLVAGTSGLCAQAAPPPARFSLSAGVGAAAIGETAGAIVADVAYQRRSQLFVLHSSLVMGGYELSHVGLELGLLYGRASTRQTEDQLAAAIGLAAVQVDIAGEELENVIGVPIVAEASLNAPVVGIGIRGFANLNAAQSYAGLTLIVRIGRLRARGA
jgi:hypothetical protein